MEKKSDNTQPPGSLLQVSVLCMGNPENQTAVAEHGGIEPLVEFLTVDSHILQAASASAIAALCAGTYQSQVEIQHPPIT